MNPRIAFQTIWDRCQHTVEVYGALKYLQALAEIPVEKHQKNDTERLERRLKHLLQSDFIRSFDEVNPHTKEYKRDIKEADKAVRCSCSNCIKATIIEERPHGEWIVNNRYKRKGKKFLDCSECHYGENGDIICEVKKIPNFCPNCGASMDGIRKVINKCD